MPRLAFFLLLLAAGAARAQDGGVTVPLGPEGGFVNLRDPRRAIGLGTVQLIDGNRVSTEHGGAQCVPLAWNGAAQPGRWPLTLSDGRFVTSLLLRATERGLKLVVLEVRDSGGDALPASCVTDFVPGPLTAESWETNLGPVFRDAGRCQALAAKGFSRRCENGTCRDEEGHARLFDLGACETLLRAVKGRLGLLGRAHQPAKLASLDQLREVLRKGGTLFERRETAAAAFCVPWRASPRGPLKAHLTAKWTRDGMRTTEELDLEVWPLDRLAFEQNHTRLQQTLDGGGIGMSGSSGYGQVPLAFGDGRVLLGDRWFFFGKAECGRDP